MRYPLTCVYSTSRKKPRLDWFVDSLRLQVKPKDDIHIIIVSLYPQTMPDWDSTRIKMVEPKPTVWQGKHRLTKAEWWAASSARNTGICLCETPWIAFLDDRSLLLPGWLTAIDAAMTQGYAVCGAYEKVHDLVVENGVPKSYKETDGKDPRYRELVEGKLDGKGPIKCPGGWWFGCSTALPLEWCLKVNGYDETCDGIGSEDSMFGLMLENNKFPICYDHTMKILEDRTPSEAGEQTIRRDKGISPNDKSHALLNMLRYRLRAAHDIDLSAIRQSFRWGTEFPIPTGPQTDWFDGQRLSEMTPG